MTPRTLIRRSLRYHWRAHLGVVLGAAVGSAALIGALVVGDSVKGSLRETSQMRLGKIAFAMTSGDRFVSERLGGVLVLPGTVARVDGNARANRIQLIGANNRFLNLGVQPSDTSILPGEIHLNRALAIQLGAKVGDDLILRVNKLSAFPQESAISPRSSSVALRLRVANIRAARYFGDFSLQISAEPVLNAFVNLSELQTATDLTGRANVVLWPAETKYHANLLRTGLQKVLPASYVNDLQLLTGVNSDLWADKELEGSDEKAFRSIRESIELASAGLLQQLSDVDLDFHQIRGEQAFELRTRRVFLDGSVVKAGLAAATNSQTILTYLGSLLRAGTNSTPYSMVTATGAPWTPAGLRDDEIVVSQWLADDLMIKPGDEIDLSYFLPESGAKLTEATNTFRVHSIVPMEMPWADRTLMPDFPGIEKTESTRDWDAGFPLTYKIRDKDEDYWKQHRGTPKAFITLAAGQKMWGNRFGNLTAIRFPVSTNAFLDPSIVHGERVMMRARWQSKSVTGENSTALQKSEGERRLSPLPGGEGQGEGERHTNIAENFRFVMEGRILANLKPEELGLRFEPVREQALKAAEQSQDFGGLFLGFSFFLIGAALLLMAMLFQFGLEQRATEIGTLLALGFTPKQVRNLFLGEGVALAFIGGVIGAIGGIYYAKAMLHGLNTVWRDAVGATALGFHITTQTMVIGFFASVVVSAITIWLALRKFVKRSPRELLAGEVGTEESGVRSSKVKVMAVGALLAAVALCGWAVVSGDTTNAGIFFGAGALLLVAGLSFANEWLARLVGVQSRAMRDCSGSSLKRGLQRAESEFNAPVTMASLAVRGCARRRKRSLATIAMLACGSFLIVSIGVFRLDANRDASKRSSGTGGFALIGETTMPVVQDMNAQSGRDFFALNERDLDGVSFVPFRVRAGDEASCLNLNAAQRPRLLGVNPEILSDRFVFTKNLNEMTKAWPWSALSRHILSVPLDKNEIPAIGDANSIQWAMHKKVGDTIDYVDERGQPFKVRIVGAVANSILQGQLIIDEGDFIEKFPSESGYRMFLIDAPSNAVSQVSATLSRAMQDVGLELTPAPQRLAQFNAVQNTYLGTFQVLGGLGLLLGSVGLGIVVLRNVLERRGELAVMMALGFRKATLQRLLLIENGALLLAGLALGVATAAVAVLPALFSAHGELPVASLAMTLAGVLVNGALWTWAATRFAVRGDLLKALRNE
ncbi:MAG: ABC transporter permease [Verrucomicrobia bacterium]|nr:ABC transporter permease [Verrucomicrobiota bacterium]